MTEYQITIVNKDQDEPPVKAVSGTNSTAKVGGEVSAGSGEKAAQYVANAAKKLVTAGAIIRTVNQVVSFQNSLISLQTGQQEYAQRVNYTYQKASSFVTAVAMGAISGSGAGPIGALAGAAIGAVTNIGSNVVNYLKSQTVISTQQSLEDISRNMRATRMTTSGRRYSNITEF